MRRRQAEGRNRRKTLVCKKPRVEDIQQKKSQNRRPDPWIIVQVFREDKGA